MTDTPDQNDEIVSEPREPRLYEFAFLVKQEADVAEVTKLLSQHGGTVTNEGSLRHLQLAYPIKKQTDAFFGFLQVRLTPDHAKQLEHDAGLNPAILRCLLVIAQVAPPSTPRFDRTREVAPASLGERPTATVRPTSTEGNVLSNEELEKKIEEILA